MDLDELPKLRRDVTALQAKVAALETGPRATAMPISASVETGLEGVLREMLAPLVDRVSALEERLTTITTPPYAPPADDGQLSLDGAGHGDDQGRG